MKLELVLLAVVAATTATAFAPRAFVVAPGHLLSKHAAPSASRLFMVDDVSLEEEVEKLVQAEITKTKRMSNLRNENGVEYAPWMRITEEDELRIRKMMRDKAEARRRRKDDEAGVKGNLLMDSQAQELSGTGMRYKVINGNDVELEWATSREANTRGFIIKRRPAKTSDFEVLASYQSYGPLASKGKDGGLYRFLDENVAPGGWVYRITECENSGNENDLSQCLVDVQTAEEQLGGVIAAVALGVVAIGAVLAGSFLDPVQY
jgi:hypothetical protein